MKFGVRCGHGTTLTASCEDCLKAGWQYRDDYTRALLKEAADHLMAVCDVKALGECEIAKAIYRLPGTVEDGSGLD